VFPSCKEDQPLI